MKRVRQQKTPRPTLTLVERRGSGDGKKEGVMVDRDVIVLQCTLQACAEMATTYGCLCMNTILACFNMLKYKKMQETGSLQRIAFE